MGSSIVLPALVDIAAEFDSTATVVNLSVAFYMLSMSIFPLWWSSFSETLGRRTIYVVSFGLFLLFNVLSAVSTSIGMFIAMRVLSGGAAASVQAVGAGTIADLWEVKERGKAMGMFYLGPLCGPLIAPILGGVLAQNLGWRSAQWFLAIFAVILWILIVFLLPETLKSRKSLAAAAEQEAADNTATTPSSPDNDKNAPRPDLTRTTTQRSAVAIKAKKYTILARRIFLDPLRIILYLQLPAVAILVAYAAVTFGSLYVLNISIQATFSSAPYNYGSTIVGCLYIPNSAGYIFSSIFGGRWVDRIMEREAVKAGRYDEKGRLQFIPEDRMKENAWLGAIVFPLSLIAYGWCAEYKVNVAGPMVANFFFGVGSMLIFALVTTMLTEFMPRKSSHGIALNNFVRNIFSCVGSIVTEPLLKAIGNGWLFLGLGVISLATGGLTIWAMKRFGPGWRLDMARRMDRVLGEKG
jgi:multidrug resistance protein